MTRLFVAVLAVVLFASASSFALVHDVSLTGKAGPGLIAGNENHTINGTPGSGGEVNVGITYDDVLNSLDINIGWGSGNGFTDLTGNAIGGHIHGPTASPAPASFFEDAGVMIGLDSLSGWNPNAVNGGFDNAVTLTGAQETNLMDGKLYINIHTPSNGGGEIRGYLIVPEPGSAGVLLCVASGALLRRRRGV